MARSTLIPSLEDLAGAVDSPPPAGVEPALIFPFPGQASTTAEAEPFSWYPFRASEDFVIGLRFQVRRMEFTYTMAFASFGLDLSGSQIVEVSPRVGPDDETSRESEEDNWRWYAQRTFGAFPNVIDYEVQLMPPDEAVSPDPRYYYREDNATVVPRLKISLIVSYSDGPEFRLELSTGERPPVLSRTLNYQEVKITLYGQEMDAWVEPEIPLTAFALSITAPAAGGFWEYRDATGENAITDGDDNEQLRAQWPPEGPNALLAP